MFCYLIFSEIILLTAPVLFFHCEGMCTHRASLNILGQGIYIWFSLHSLRNPLLSRINSTEGKISPLHGTVKGKTFRSSIADTILLIFPVLKGETGVSRMLLDLVVLNSAMLLTLLL